MIEPTGRGRGPGRVTGPLCLPGLVVLALCACSGDLQDPGESLGDLGFIDSGSLDRGTRRDSTTPVADAGPDPDTQVTDASPADTTGSDLRPTDSRPLGDFAIGDCDGFSISLSEATQRTCDNVLAERVSDCETTGGTWTGDRLCRASGDRWIGSGACDGDCALPDCLHYNAHPSDTDKAACDAVLQLRKTDCLNAGCNWVGASVCQFESSSGGVNTYGGQGICL